MFFLSIRHLLKFPFFFFFFNDTATTEIYTLSLHDALPIFRRLQPGVLPPALPRRAGDAAPHLHLPARRGLEHRQLRLDGRSLRYRCGRAPLHAQRMEEPAQRSAGARGPLGRADARVADVVTAAGTRLRHDPSRVWPRLLLAREIRAPRGRGRAAAPRPAEWDPRISPSCSITLAGRNRAWNGAGGGGCADPSRRGPRGRVPDRVRRIPSRPRAPPDADARAPDWRAGSRPPQGGDVGLPRLRMLLLRHAHRDLPRVQGEKRRRARAAPDPRHPGDDDFYLRSSDVEPAHGPGARRRAAR